MQDRELNRIEPDMDVCDVNGDKLGTVARVYRNDLSRIGAAAGAIQQPREEVVEVKSGFLGLGRHLYVPMGAVHDVTAGGVFLGRTRDGIDRMNWQEKPAYLDEMS